MSEIENVIIEDVSLTMADHGVLTYSIGVKGKGFCVNLGNYVIGKGYLGAKTFKGSAKGLEAMMHIMDVVGVRRWEDLKGKYARIVKHGFGQVVTEIGNIIEDKWFDQKEFFKEEEE